MNKKGFTLIEVLAAIVILGIISTIAVSSTTNLIKKQKEKSYINDLEKLVALAKYDRKRNHHNEVIIVFSDDESICSTVRNCVIFYDIETSANNLKYTSGKVDFSSEIPSACLTDGKNKIEKDASGTYNMSYGEGLSC